MTEFGIYACITCIILGVIVLLLKLVLSYQKQTRHIAIETYKATNKLVTGFNLVDEKLDNIATDVSYIKSKLPRQEPTDPLERAIDQLAKYKKMLDRAVEVLTKSE